jgi:5'-nucleotidase/UDP-sugar diphosphatase
VTRPKGERIQDVKVKTPAGVYAPIDQDAIYKVVVNNFMAAGGDRYDTLKEAAGKYDTGFNDAEVFMEYISGKVLVNLPEERIVLKR